MYHQKAGQKRKRPGGERMEFPVATNWGKSIACCSFLFLASYLTVSIEGFTSIPSISRPGSKHWSRFSVHLFTQVVDEQITVQTTLPPWLTQYEVATWADVVEQLEALERRLLHFSWEHSEVAKVLKAINTISQGDRSVALGCMDFISVYMDSLSSELDSIFLSPAVLQASIKHYVQCVLVRKSGALENVKEDVLMKPHDFMRPRDVAGRRQDKLSDSLQLQSKAKAPVEVVANSNAIVPVYPMHGKRQMDPEVEAICSAAARIKRAEILIQALLPPSHTMSDRVLGLLLSVTDDFRALMVRCVACLYRLQAIAEDDSRKLSPQTIRLAKDGLQVYAILAGRLGLPLLKKRIENAAFRVLYRRQHRAVSSFYTQVGPLMNTVANYLQAEAIQTLQKDEKLMALVEELDVESRVKEPLSLWKKLLKKSQSRALILGDHSPLPSSPVFIEEDSTATKSFPPELASSDVFDFVALRVVVRARKWSEKEDDELTREREKLLCYYIQNRLRAQWGASRMKDYIQFPKPNGYQSLHHTSGIELRGGIHVPFEVQIRSEAMHHVAEYGVASHWCYKLDNSDRRITSKLLPPCSAVPAAALLDGKGEEETINKSSLRPNDRSSKSYLEALHLAKRAEANIYVFMGGEDETSEYMGRLISLPSNACVRDALAEINNKELTNEVGNKTIMRNGQKADLHEVVANGDVLWLTPSCN